MVGPDSVAQSLIIDGDKPFYIPTEFKAQSLSFTKSGEGSQALLLPFDTWAGLGVVNADGTVDDTPETYAGTFAEAENGYVFDGNNFVFAEGISPFTYVWDEADGIKEIDNRQRTSFSSTKSTDNGLPVYNIAGQRVSKPAKGLYIVGGRKVIVK